MQEPLGFFLTWTCYGTWLHGDVRGSVALGQNIPGTERVAPESRMRRYEARNLGSAAMLLSADARRIVAAAMQEHARVRQWEIRALAVQSEHVHVVVANAGLRPEQMLSSFKAWSTRRLREQGLVGPDQRVWSRHGSTRWLWDERSVSNASAYVGEGQCGPR